MSTLHRVAGLLFTFYWLFYLANIQCTFSSNTRNTTMQLNNVMHSLSAVVPRHWGAVNEPFVVASMLHPDCWSIKAHPRALVNLGGGGWRLVLATKEVGAGRRYDPPYEVWGVLDPGGGSPPTKFLPPPGIFSKPPENNCPPHLKMKKLCSCILEGRLTTNPILSALHLQGLKSNIYVHFPQVNKPLIRISFQKWNHRWRT
jgi:hypothetical protein